MLFVFLCSPFRWCCDPDNRINNIDEIKAHPFFDGVDWQNIRYLLNCFCIRLPEKGLGFHANNRTHINGEIKLIMRGV